MKQKIKIMKDRPELSDEEIQRYMNFDGVVEKHNEARVAGKKWRSRIYWISSTVAVVLTLWYFSSSDVNTEPVKLQPNLQQQQHVNEVQEEKETPKSNDAQGSKEKVIITKNPIVEKQEVIKSSKDSSGISITSMEAIYIQAEPVNGFTALYDYLNTNLVYPAEAVKDSTQGVQVVSFIINTNGKPEKIQIEHSLGEPFEKEAARLIENMPLWKPATLNGKPVRSKISLPITFQIYKN